MIEMTEFFSFVLFGIGVRWQRGEWGESLVDGPRFFSFLPATLEFGVFCLVCAEKGVATTTTIRTVHWTGRSG